MFEFTSIFASSVFDDDDFFHRRVLVRLVRVSAASVVTEEATSNLVLVLLETFLADSTEDERGIVEAPDCFRRARRRSFIVIVFAQRGRSGELVANI